MEDLGKDDGSENDFLLVPSSMKEKNDLNQERESHTFMALPDRPVTLVELRDLLQTLLVKVAHIELVLGGQKEDEPDDVVGLASLDLDLSPPREDPKDDMGTTDFDVDAEVAGSGAVATGGGSGYGDHQAMHRGLGPKISAPHGNLPSDNFGMENNDWHRIARAPSLVPPTRGPKPHTANTEAEQVGDDVLRMPILVTSVLASKDPSAEPTNSVVSCTLCRDRTPVPDPSLDFRGFYTCGDAERQASLLEDDQELCKIWQATYGSYCGCEANQELTIPEYTSCSLCVDSTRVPNHSYFIDRGGGFTCGDFDFKLALSEERYGDVECTFMQATAGVYCGCEANVELHTQESVCSLCSDGSHVPDPKLEIEEGYSCAQAELEAAWYATIRSDCLTFQANQGRSCGCEANKDLTFPGCFLCMDGARVPDPTLDLGGDYTCESIESEVALKVGEGQESCAIEQATNGFYCGCEANTNLGFPESHCSLCLVAGSSVHIPEPTKMVNTSKYGAKTCYELERMANEDKTCSVFQEEYGAECCIDVFRVLNREALQMLYTVTSGEGWYEQGGWMTNTSYCEWRGVECNADDLVTKISLSRNGLKGSLPTQLGQLVHLTSIELGYNRLASMLPTEFGQLTLMKKLDFSNNRLEGPIPTFFGKLNHLEFLSFPRNQLSGTFPTELGQLKSLEVFEAYENHLRGTIPSEFGKLTKLREFAALINYLTGTLPADLGDLLNLRMFLVGMNRLVGPANRVWCEQGLLASVWTLDLDKLCPPEDQILRELFNNASWHHKPPNWTSNSTPCDKGIMGGWDGVKCNEDGYVSELDLTGYGLVGSLPHAIGYLTHLQRIALGGNSLSGTLPAQFGDLIHLREFNMSGNSLVGTIPTRLGRLINCEIFDIKDNHFERGLPSEIGRMQSLRHLSLSQNSFSGELPTEMGNIEMLKTLHVGDNLFSGPFPLSLVGLSNLEDLQLQGNKMTGEIPPLIGELSALTYLDLSENQITGIIPPNIGSLHFLRTLLLSHNKLKGQIPAEIGELSYLESLGLSHNMLMGRICTEIGKLRALQQLDLSHNHLQGIIPSQLGDLLSLKEALLIGRNNSFDEPAPINLCDIEHFDLMKGSLCPNERIILKIFYQETNGQYWSTNTGWLDPYSSHCRWHGVNCENNSVVSLMMASNSLQGTFPRELSKLTSLKTLVLSDNKIMGSIPTELGMLQDLTELRVSYNELTGNVPSELGGLPLSFIHLHGNKLTGSAPTINNANGANAPDWFIADCGRPSFFQNPIKCESCSMCCNILQECQFQDNVETLIFAKRITVFLGAITIFCFLVFVVVRQFMQRSESQKYNSDARTVCSESIYTLLLTRSKVGWLMAVVTAIVQAVMYGIYLDAAEMNFDNDRSDMVYFWRCPHNSRTCNEDKDISDLGWVVFGLLMFTHLAPDLLNAVKLIHISAVRPKSGRCLLAGMTLFLISALAIWASASFNWITAGTNTELIMNTSILLFVTDLDEHVFRLLKTASPSRADDVIQEAEKYVGRKDSEENIESSTHWIVTKNNVDEFTEVQMSKINDLITNRVKEELLQITNRLSASSDEGSSCHLDPSKNSEFAFPI